MATLFQLPKTVPLSGTTTYPGAKAYFYQSGTTTPITTYTTAALSVPHANPVVADANGVFAAIFLDEGANATYKLRLNTSSDVLIYEVDNIPTSLNQQNLGAVLWPRSQAERDASVTPTNYYYEWGNVLRYGTNTTPGTTDMTAAIQAAINQSEVGGATATIGGILKTNGVITADSADVSIHFDNAKISVGDTGTSGTISNSASGKMGFLFKSADRLKITGSVTLIGTGTLGTTSLAGMVFDSCDYVLAPCAMHFENMAAGRFVFWCDRGLFGNVTAKDMYGKQTFQSPPTNTQGSIEVVIGCVESNFGNLVGANIWKPCRYLSVAVDGAAASIDNTRCSFGSISATAYSGSTESLLSQIRSAKDCNFGPVVGTGFVQGIALAQVSGDEAFTVDGNKFAHIGGIIPGSAASLDTAITSQTTASNPIGTNRVESINASVTGEYGLFCESGTLSVGEATISGAPTRNIYCQGSRLRIGIANLSGAEKEAILFGKGGDVSIGEVNITTGATGTSTRAIFYNDGGTGSYIAPRFGNIKYAQNSVGTDYSYIYQDSTNGPEGTIIGSITGTGSSAQCRWLTETYTIFKDGRLAINGTAAPTTGTWAAGSAVWRAAPAAAAVPGWMCTAAGTPGTWKDMAALAA